MMLTNPVDSWSTLRSKGKTRHGGEDRVVDTKVLAEGKKSYFILFDMNDPALLLPISSNENLTELISNSSAALRFDERIYDIEHGRAQKYLLIWSPVRELESVFADVSAQILVRIQRGESVVEATLNTTNDFRSLFYEQEVITVGREEVSGLVGELYLLNRMLDFDKSAYLSWLGPLGDRHDFRNDALAVEVKTSSRPGVRNIKISSVMQLLPPSGGNLFLCHVEVEQDPAGLLSVSSLVNSVVTKSGRLDKIRMLLHGLGCEDHEADEWNAYRFNFHDMTVYEVVDGFPSVTSEYFIGGQIPSGVSGITYQIDLSAAMDYVLDGMGVDGVLQKVALCS